MAENLITCVKVLITTHDISTLKFILGHSAAILPLLCNIALSNKIESTLRSIQEQEMSVLSLCIDIFLTMMETKTDGIGKRVKMYLLERAGFYVGFQSILDKQSKSLDTAEQIVGFFHVLKFYDVLSTPTRTSQTDSILLSILPPVQYDKFLLQKTKTSPVLESAITYLSNKSASRQFLSATMHRVFGIFLLLKTAAPASLGIEWKIMTCKLNYLFGQFLEHREFQYFVLKTLDDLFILALGDKPNEVVVRWCVNHLSKWLLFHCNGNENKDMAEKILNSFLRIISMEGVESRDAKKIVEEELGHPYYWSHLTMRTILKYGLDGVLRYLIDCIEMSVLRHVMLGKTGRRIGTASDGATRKMGQTQTSVGVWVEKEYFKYILDLSKLTKELEWDDMVSGSVKSIVQDHQKALNDLGKDLIKAAPLPKSCIASPLIVQKQLKSHTLIPRSAPSRLEPLRRPMTGPIPHNNPPTSLSRMQPLHRKSSPTMVPIPPIGSPPIIAPLRRASGGTRK